MCDAWTLKSAKVPSTGIAGVDSGAFFMQNVCSVTKDQALPYGLYCTIMWTSVKYVVIAKRRILKRRPLGLSGTGERATDPLLLGMVSCPVVVSSPFCLSCGSS